MLAPALRDCLDNLEVWSYHIGIAMYAFGVSKFFGPFPRKHRLTVYRGFQVRRDRPEIMIFEECRVLHLEQLLGLALRVSLAVTWLTVYRQLYIMRPGPGQTCWEAKGCVA